MSRWDATCTLGRQTNKQVVTPLLDSHRRPTTTTETTAEKRFPQCNSRCNRQGCSSYRTQAWRTPCIRSELQRSSCSDRLTPQSQYGSSISETTSPMATRKRKTKAWKSPSCCWVDRTDHLSTFWLFKFRVDQLRVCWGSLKSWWCWWSCRDGRSQMKSFFLFFFKLRKKQCLYEGRTSNQKRVWFNGESEFPRIPKRQTPSIEKLKKKHLKRNQTKKKKKTKILPSGSLSIPDLFNFLLSNRFCIFTERLYRSSQFPRFRYRTLLLVFAFSLLFRSCITKKIVFWCCSSSTNNCDGE